MGRTRRLAGSRGASLVEYLVVLGAIAMVALGAARYFGQRVDSKAQQQAACVGSLACGSSGGVSGDAVSATSPPPDDASGGAPDSAHGASKPLWQRGFDVGKGFVLGAWDTVTGLVHVVAHPIETAESLWGAVTHPVVTFHAIKDGVVAAWNENPEELVGRGIFEVVTLPFAAAKASKLKLVGATRKLRAADAVDDATAVVKTVDEAADGAKLGKGAVAAQKEVAALTNVASPRLAVYQESVRRAASIDGLAEARYGAEIGAASLDKIRSALGPRFDVLVADPGIVMRLDDFVEFAAKQDLKTIEPWALREAYSKHLGTANVYRGLALTEEQAKAMQKEGMFAGYLRSDHTGNAAWSQGDPFSQNFYSMMKERIHGGGWGPISAAPNQPAMDALMSVTYKEDVAMLVTGGLVKQIGRADVKMYIYRIDLPKLDLLPGPVFDRFPAYVNNDELFVPFKIRPEEIVSMDGPLEPRMIDLGGPDP